MQCPTLSVCSAQYDGAWNKLALLARVMNQSLERRGMARVSGIAHNRSSAQWVLWADWDLVFTDLSVALPLEEYEVELHHSTPYHTLR